jgi:hypothetical protein
MFRKYNMLLALAFGMFTITSSANAVKNARTEEQKVEKFEKCNKKAQRDYDKCTKKCRKTIKEDEARYECVQQCQDELKKSFDACGTPEAPAQDESQGENAQ